MKNVAKANNAQATERAAGVAHAAVDSAAAKAENLEKQLRAGMENASERLTDTKKSASDQVQQTLKKAEKFANERPLAATGIAFAAGIIAASFLRRS